MNTMGIFAWTLIKTLVGISPILLIGVALLWHQRRRRGWSEQGKVQGYDKYTGELSPFGAAKEQAAIVRSGKSLPSNPESWFAAIVCTLVGIAYPFLTSTKTGITAGSPKSFVIGGAFFILGMVLFYGQYNAYKQVAPTSIKFRWFALAALFVGLGLLVVPMFIDFSSGQGANWHYAIYPLIMAALASLGYWWSNRKKSENL